MSTSWTLRPLTTQDEALLAQATLGNINWSGQQVTPHDVQTQPRFRHYTELIPHRGDFGIVAEVADEPIGVVWAQYLGPSLPAQAGSMKARLRNRSQRAAAKARLTAPPAECPSRWNRSKLAASAASPRLRTLGAADGRRGEGCWLRNPGRGLHGRDQVDVQHRVGDGAHRQDRRGEGARPRKRRDR